MHHNTTEKPYSQGKTSRSKQIEAAQAQWVKDEKELSENILFLVVQFHSSGSKISLPLFCSSLLFI